MEACPKVPMLAFELKLCNIESNEFSEKILKYILTHYQENPESFQKEITDLNLLREGAMCASKDFMGLNLLKKYYNQLQFISNRFPMKAGEPCETEFSWDDLFHEKEIVHNDIRFEQQCILYNIGAMHSYLGCLDKRLNDEGIKKSCTHFQFAAWAFQIVRDAYSGYGFTPDLNEDIMSFKMNLMLAQAQECVLEKSIIDSRKPSINSKISTQIIDYYKLALTNNEKPDFHNNVGSRLSKDWKNYCTFKINYYTALSNYFGALASAEQEKYGESIGYIQVCEAKLVECNKMKNIFKEFQDILKYTTECIDTKSKSLKKDNDFVYNQKIISPTDLPEIKGVSLVKCLAIDFINDPDVVSQDIFIRLVSMKAHELSSMYSEDKAKLLRQITAQIDDKNAQLNQFMSALQIDQLHLDNYDYLKLPKQLLECCAAISVKPSVLKEDIPKAMKSIVNVSVQAKDILDEIEDVIENEEKEHREDKIKSGKMNESDSDSDSSDTDDDTVSSLRSKKLKEISKRYDVLIKNYNDANASNTALHEAFNSIIKNLQLLALPLNDLSEKLPAIEPINDEESRQIRDKLVSLLAKVDEMKTQREQLLKRLQLALQDDDLTKLIASKQNDIQNPSEFFSEQIKKHDQLVVYLQQNLQAQDNILRALAEANAQFATDRKKILDATQQRNAFVDSLVLSYQSVSDLVEKASKGVLFFQNLLQPLNELLSDVKDFCAKSKQERENRKKLFSTFVSPSKQLFVPDQMQLPGQQLPPQQQPVFNRYRPQPIPKIDQLSLSDNMPTPSNDRPKLKDFLPFMKPQTWGNNASNKSNGPPTVDRSSHNLVPGMGNLTQMNPNMNNQQMMIPANPMLSNPTVPVVPQVNKPNLPVYNNPPPVAPSNPQFNQINANNQYPLNGNSLNPLTNKAVLDQPQANIMANLPSQQSPMPPHQSVQPPFNPQQMNAYYPPNQMQLPVANQQSTNFIPQQQQQQQAMLNQDLLMQQQQKKEQELYKMKLEQEKMYHQKILEQQEKEKEIEAKKKELEEKERLFNMQQQQFYLQQQQQQQLQHQKLQLQHQQQNFVNQQMPPQPNLIPNIMPAQLSNSYLASQQLPPPAPSPALPPITQQTQPAQPAQTKPVDELLDSIKPGSVYKPGFFKQMKIEDNLNSKNLATPLQPPVASQSPAMFPTNQTVAHQPPAVFNPSFQPIQQQQQQQPSFIPQQINGYYTAQINPAVVNHQINPSSVNIRPNLPNVPMNYGLNQPSQPQPVVANKPSAIDDLLDLFDGKNTQISIPALQPLKADSLQPANHLSEQKQQDVDQSMNRPAQEIKQTELNHDVSLSLETKQIEQPVVAKSPPPPVSQKEEKHKLPISVSNSSINSTASSSPISTPTITPSTTTTTTSTKKLNFLNNPTKLDKFVSEVNKFENHVKSLTQKTLSNATILEKEWKDLNDYQEKNVNNYTISVARCYPNKNRFPDLLPYDQTRIVLQSKSGDDYINASNIGQLDTDVASPSFIISQAPASSTDSFNFWSMIIEQQIELVVCLCRDAELNNPSVNNSSAYWPLDKLTPLNVNSIKITLLSIKETSHSIQRICTVKNALDNQSRTVIILQHVIQNNSNLLSTVSTGIGLNELPENISSLLKFIKEVEYFYKTQQRSLTHPVLVHCMNGVSRSAVFILIYNVIQVIDLNCDTNSAAAASTTLSLTDLLIRYVKQMRSKRKYMIQSMCHLKYAYEAVLYYLKDILIKEGVLNNVSFNEIHASSMIVNNGENGSRKQSVDSNILNDDSLVSIQSSKSNETPLNISTTSPKQQQQQLLAQQSPQQNGSSVNKSPVSTSATTKSSPVLSLNDLCDPSKFTLSLNEDSTKKKHKFTKNDFLNPNSTKQPDLANANDPFRMLDPLAK